MANLVAFYGFTTEVQISNFSPVTGHSHYSIIMLVKSYQCLYLPACSGDSRVITSLLLLSYSFSSVTFFF